MPKEILKDLSLPLLPRSVAQIYLLYALSSSVLTQCTHSAILDLLAPSHAVNPTSVFLVTKAKCLN